MIKCLNKYGIAFEATYPSTAVQKGMPLWHHPGEDHQKRQVNNGEVASCLRKNHASITIGNGMDLAKRLEDPLHEGKASCDCVACEEDRTTRGCNDPHACVRSAASRLRQILPKWIPTPDEEGRQIPGTFQTAKEEETGLFKPPNGISTISQDLRAMTLRIDEPKERTATPVQRRRAVARPIPTKMEIHISGVTHAPSSNRARTAAGVFVKSDDEGNKGVCIPSAEEQSQYVAELYAALAAVR
ncbi:hypothetical protein DFH07DRAFT_762565, partial [Mycena maculata]